MTVEVIEIINTVEVSDNQNTVEVLQQDNVVEVTSFGSVIEVTEVNNFIEVTSVGLQGSIGPSGGSAYSVVTGEVINAYQGVVLIGGQAFIADITDISHIGRFIGLARQTVNSGFPIDIQYTGKISGGLFIPGSRYYLGLNGILTTNPEPPGALWTMIVGVAESSSDLILTPHNIIEL